MDVQIPDSIKSPRQILAFVSKRKNLSSKDSKKLFTFVFTQNKNPDRGQRLNLISKFRL